MRNGALRLSVPVVSACVLFFLLGSTGVGRAQVQGEGKGVASWSTPRTAWGAPDLQGVWDYRTMTPLERPREFSGKAVMSDEEAAAYTTRRLAEQADYDLAPSVHAKWWLDYGKELTDDHRTSLIVDPADGRIPHLTEAARERGAARAERRRTHGADAAEYRGLTERCLSFGTPRLPGAYNNNYHILQTPEYVAIVSEMVHDARIVPLDGRPLPSIPQWHGESRGHWEGDTLVVESASYTAQGAFRGSTAGVRIVERFTRVASDTIEYEIRAEDQATWAAPWSVMFPMKKASQPMFEYACHEGNYGLMNILRNARLEELISGVATP